MKTTLMFQLSFDNAVVVTILLGTISNDVHVDSNLNHPVNEQIHHVLHHRLILRDLIDFKVKTLILYCESNF